MDFGLKCKDLLLITYYSFSLHAYILIHEKNMVTKLNDVDTERPSGETEVILDDESVGYFRPYYTLLLVFGSFIHIFGNILVTILLYKFYAYVLFTFSYSIALSLYAYFIYLDTHTIAIPPARK